MYIQAHLCFHPSITNFFDTWGQQKQAVYMLYGKVANLQIQQLLAT